MFCIYQNLVQSKISCEFRKEKGALSSIEIDLRDYPLIILENKIFIP